MKYKIDGVILAAGLSSRIGTFKMGLEILGKSILMHTVDKMRQFTSQQIVVAGHQMHRVVDLTKGNPALRVVFNPNYKAGMFSSVKQGVTYVTADWFFFIPGDYPLVNSNTYQALLDARDANPDGNVFIPYHLHTGRKGHPILVNASLKDELLAEPVDNNLKAFIQRKGFQTVPVEDEGILTDIDTLEDYRRAIAIAEAQNNTQNTD